MAKKEIEVKDKLIKDLENKVKQMALYEIGIENDSDQGKDNEMNKLG